MKHRKQTRQAHQHAHNSASLNELLAHIENHCAAQCQELEAQAEAEARSVIAQARAHAAALIQRARVRERAEARERFRAEQARQRMRLRLAWLEHRRHLAERGVQRLTRALNELWRGSVEARVGWLQRALDEAAQVLPCGAWRVARPATWEVDEGRDAVDRFLRDRDGLELTFAADTEITAGFRVGCRASHVDLTPNGLLARRDRVAGYLLAGLNAEPPDLPDE